MCFSPKCQRQDRNGDDKDNVVPKRGSTREKERKERDDEDDSPDDILI